ncbi:MAG: hypothetical protein OEY34_05725 [Cyclobacteriaceae bacterium]|nr:hypothetical protein [Cyclobacteriaceae bacterium]
MAGLTEEQAEFIKKNKISKSALYDAEGKSKEELQKDMKAEGKTVAYNVEPCEEHGHTMSSRSGYCIQCDPASVSSVKKSAVMGLVYIAGSLKGQIITVGFTKSKTIKEEALNRNNTGGYGDWEILFSTQSMDASEIEYFTQNQLQKYSMSQDNEAKELFCCSYSKAKETIEGILEEKDFKVTKISENRAIISYYEFRNLVRKV